MDRVYDPRDDDTLDAWSALVPDDAATRGMFFHNIADALKAGGLPPPEEHFIAFKHYPLKTYWALMRDAAARLHPDEPEALGVYQIAHVVYPNFAASMLGRAIFAVAGRDFGRIVSLAPRAYEASNTRGKFIIESLKDNATVVRLEDIWDPVPFSAGIWRGAFSICDIQPTHFSIDVEKPGDIVITARW